MKSNVKNNFHRISNNSKDEDKQTSSNKVPHYEQSNNWKGRSTIESSKVFEQNSNKRFKPPLVTKGLLPLNSSFIMKNNGTENIPPVPTNDSAALAAMLSVPPPNVLNGGNDNSTKQVVPLGSSQPSGDAKTEVTAKDDAQTAWTLLHKYWTFVQENPYDFNGWSHLLSHVESMKHIEAARSAFEGFLPLYPYCFAYWKKLADLELKYSMTPRSLGVLIYATKSIPLCTDIWMNLFSSFRNYARQENLSVDVIRYLYKIGLERIGMSWHSSPFWEECIKFELEQKDFLKVMTIYKWLISIPIKVYNKHWDQLVAVIRENHPQRILSLDVFDHYYRVCCDQLKIKYSTPQPFDPLKPPKIDDQIMMLIKEKILAGLIKIHEENTKEVDKRWKFEEKIKRPYFHVKPIEKKQLKAWNNYLDFEVKQGDPIRILVLFERCLVSCAQYEVMWCRYASFLESHVPHVIGGKYKDIIYHPGCFSHENNDSEINKPGKNSTCENDNVDNLKKGTWFDFYYDIGEDVKAEGNTLMDQFCDGVEVGSRVLTCPTLTAAWILREITWEDVRQVYRRASWIHCPSKPLLLMQWAEFEESQGDVQTARDLLNTVLSKHPKLLRARIQLIDLERRSGMLDRVEELYSDAFSSFKEPKQKSYIAIRFARFLFKFKNDHDTALALIRKVLKKDKGNVYLYNQVFNICYEKRPVDCDGVLAAVMLALASKELTLDQKRQFCLQRAQFLREHGTITQIKEAQMELLEIESKLDYIKEEEEKIEKEIKKVEEQRKKEQERLEREQKEKESKKAEELKRENALELGELEKGSDDDSYQSRRNAPMKRFAQGDGHKMDHDNRKKKRRHKRSPSPRNVHSRRPREKRRKRSSMRNDEQPHQNFRRSSKSVEKSENMGSIQNDFLPPPPQPDGILSMTEFPDVKVSNVATIHITDNLNQPPPIMVPPPITRPPLMKPDPIRFLGRQSNIIMRPPPPNMFNEGGMQRPPPQRPMKDPPPNPNTGILGEYSINRNVGNRIIPPLLSLNTAPPSQDDGKNQNSNDRILQGPGPINHTQSKGQLGPLNIGQPPGPRMPMNTAQSQGQLRPMNVIQPQLQLRPISVQSRAQLRPINVQTPGQLRPINVQTQGQLRPINVQTQGQLRPINVQPQVQLRPINVQTQGQPRPVNVPSQVQLRQINPGQSQRQMGSLNPVRPLLLGQAPGPLRAPINPVQTPISVRPFNPPTINRPAFQANIPKAPRTGSKGTAVMNVPDWLVSEGGELKLSQGPRGDCVLKYWPRFMNEMGHDKLLSALRKSIKWMNQNVPRPSGEMVELPVMMSWLGPCDYKKDGVALNANPVWPPEIVDLLHTLCRVCEMDTEFNSCLLRLYRNGYDHQEWDSEEHPAMNTHPKIAVVSVGAIRSLEMKHRHEDRYIRFPLLPGSLLFMEGATQSDWIHQITKDAKVGGERISLSFRTMLMINGLTV